MVEYIGKDKRMSKKLSLRKLAEKAGVSYSSISNWETGKTVPDLASLELVANTLEEKPWDLIIFS